MQNAPISRFSIPADLFTADLFAGDAVHAVDGTASVVPPAAAVPPVEFLRAVRGLHAAACEQAEVAGLPAPVVAPVALPARPAGEPVVAFCPQAVKLGPVLAIDVAYARVVVLGAEEVAELELTDETQFFVGRTADGRQAYTGFAGAEIALRQLEVDAAEQGA